MSSDAPNGDQRRPARPGESQTRDTGNPQHPIGASDRRFSPALPALLLAILALAMITTVGFVGIGLWKDLNHNLQSLQTRLARAAQAQRNLQSAIDDVYAALAAQQRRQQEQEREIAKRPSRREERIDVIGSEEQRIRQQESRLKALAVGIHQPMEHSDDQAADREMVVDTGDLPETDIAPDPPDIGISPRRLQATRAAPP